MRTAVRTGAVALVGLVLGFLGAGLGLSGCDDAQNRAAGLEAVPPGFAMEITATTSLGARVEAVIVPETGLFRIELLGQQTWADMLITVRTPDTQLGYRGQVILEGKPYPLEMAFLESPLTYPGSYDLDDLKWDGNTCTATLKNDRTSIGSYEAQVDGETGIVVWERQEWDAYRGTIEITRRLVPVASVEPPSPEDVLDYARADWRETVEAARTGPFPVYGLDLPGLLLHTLQLGEEPVVAWLRYATRDNPGKIAAELSEYPEAETATWPTWSKEWQATWSDDMHDPGYGRQFVLGDRYIHVSVYSWALDELGVSLADVDQALVEMDQIPADSPTVGGSPPHLMFDDLMPLPTSSDFATTLRR